MAASVILLEAAPLNAATGFAQTVRLAGGGARQPYYYGGQHWRAGIVRLPTFITSISFEGADFGEGGVPQAAELQWAPSTKADLATLAGYFWIDAPVTVHIGPENAAGALPPLRLTGKVLSTSVEDGTLKIQLSDPAAGLKKPLLTDRFGGTGGLDGPTDWDGKIKERVWGRVWNKAGAPIDKANNIYAFADPTRPILAFDTVRDKGAPAASLVTLAWQGTAAATFAALQAAVAPRGGGVVCPSIACVKWWTQPAGDLTTDLRGEIGTGYAEKTADIVQRIVAAGPATPFASGTIAAALTARPAPIGWVANDDSTTVAAMIEELLGNSSLLWVMNAAGEIDIREWAWGQPVAAATSHAVKRTAIFRPVATRKIGYRRNERQMARGDLAAIVLAQDLELADGRTGEALAAQINDIQAIADASAAQIASAADDGTLDRKEKSSILVPRNAALEAFWSYLDAEAAAVGAPVASARSVATTARSAWIVYRDSLSPAWDNDTLDTAVVRDTLVGKLNDYSFALDVLADALRQYAATVAVWDSVSGAGKPADNADVTGDNTAKDTHAVAGVAAASVTSSIAQAAMGIAALFATYGSTENAAASALAAASSASVANQYKQDAATASAASQAARDAAVVAQALATAQAGLADTAKRDAQAATTAAQSAQAAASSSAGLADTAKRDAQAAGTAAAAAKDGAEAAQSAAQGLATSAANYASQASSSASTASTAASTASTQAGVATQAKVDAQAASSAASGAAASASANATIAGQAATSASAYRDAAQTARGGAEAARDQAAVSSDSAAGSASSAASSASVSAIAAATRGLTPNGTFTGGAGGWVTDGVTYGVWYLGKGFRVVPGSRGLVAQDPMVPVDTARTYRLNTKLVLHGSYDQSRQIYVGLSCYDVSGNFLGNVYMPQFRPNPFAGGGVHIESNEYTGTAEIAPFLDYGSFFVTGTVYVQPIALLNYGHEPYNTDINALYLEDITSEKGARDAASAAASSASSAAASSTVAGQSASAAHASETNAGTFAGQAGSYASQASSSASGAAGSATTAQQQAGVATSAAQDAAALRDQGQSYASAAAGSAAQASSKATEAAQQASAAQAAQTAANTSAGQASTSANQASAAATDAAGSASSAASSASVSAIAAATRGLTPNGTFTGGAGGWVTDGVTYGVWYLGKGFRVVPGSRGLVAQDPMVPVDTARTYRLNTKLVLHGSYDQSRQIYVGLSCYDVSGNFLGNVYMPQFRPNPFAGGGVHIESNEYTGTADIAPFLDYGSFFVTGTVYVQPIALLNYGHEPYNTDINALYLEDITSEKGARDAASAAASSASSAAASNTAAGQAASSANSSANTASTQAGAAAASAGQAATSASNAAGYANSASSSASLSASARDAAIAARDTAISNATASATSAANAAASSTSAGNSATAANQSALDAAAANGSAQAAASNAAGAASSANAAASSAYTYSQQSASYRDQANTQATNAQAYASQASASAASASSSASISAQISGVSSALTVNSKFAAWPDGAALPTAWTAWSYAGGTIVRDNSRQSSGYAALMTASSANQLGMYQRFYLTPGKYFLVATVWMQSGGWNGGGVYVDYQTGINFAVDPDNAGVAGNIGSTIRTWSKPITVTGGYGDVNIYAMTNWDGFGSGMSAKTMQWMECAIVPASAGEVQGLAATGAISTLTASVSTNSSAIASLSAQAANFEQRLTASDATALTQAGVLADHTGKLRSYLSFTAGAGAASAAVKVVATNDNGTTYSGVALEAQEITLSNSQGDNKQVALSLVGGNATFGGDLIVGGGIRFANGLKLKLSVQPVILLASDGQSISYPNAGYIPTATFQTTGLAPIGAGESYNLYLDAQTAGGATVRARIITPGTPSSYNLTADAAGGSGNPTRVVTKGTAGDAVGNQYTVAGNYASTATAYREEVSFYTANFDIVIGIYGRVGGSWVYLTSFADAFDNQYPNGGSKTYNGNFAVTITAPSGVDAFGIAGMAGSGTVNAATAITSVSWTAPGTSASTRSATPNGEKAQLTLVYNG